MIGLCTDSGSTLPAELVARFAIVVVPLTVAIDGVEHMEGSDLDVDRFYACSAGERRPIVSVSPPSAGQFAAAYNELLSRGCTEILSIHGGAPLPGVLSGARLAMHATAKSVRLVDSPATGFGVGCCVWAAALAIDEGASLDQAAAAAEGLATAIGTAFVLDALDSPVVSVRSGDRVMAIVPTLVDAVNALAAFAIEWAPRVRVAVGHSDAATAPLADALEEAVGEAAGVVEVVRYRVQPSSAGPLAGPGAFGCFTFPA